MNRVGILAALSIVPLVSAQASEWGQCGVGGQYFFIEIVRIITLMNTYRVSVGLVQRHVLRERCVRCKMIITPV